MMKGLDGVVTNVTDGGRVRNLATAGSQGHTSVGRIWQARSGSGSGSGRGRGMIVILVLNDSFRLVLRI